MKQRKVSRAEMRRYELMDKDKMDTLTPREARALARYTQILQRAHRRDRNRRREADNQPRLIIRRAEQLLGRPLDQTPSQVEIWD